MKTKDNSKKLVLKKTKVTHLKDSDLNKVNGGETLTCCTYAPTGCGRSIEFTNCPDCPTARCQ